ncbi:MAG: hypothetical protein JRJ46_06585 [Deltaproteobacteria bacterium]|nr:hypothetical protein [Deltaproteobacteria bacterium]
MIFHRNTCGWPSLFAVLALCVLLGLTYGCSTFGKKDEAKFKPGNEWIEDMRGRVAENIKDPGKKTRILALVDQAEKDLLELDRVVQQFYADIGALNDNYNASPDEYRKVISEFEADQNEVRGRIIDIRFKMRDLSTAEEWKELTDIKKRKGLYKQTIRQPGQ